jgi:hypothetical protein
LQFVHPRTGQTVSLECPIPPDFKSLLQSLSPPPRGHH